MKVNVYTKEDRIKYIELNVDVKEYFTIQQHERNRISRRVRHPIVSDHKRHQQATDTYFR